LSAHEQAESCAIHGFCDGRLWSDPTPEDLRELAKCGRLLYDTPEFVVGGDPYPRAALVEAAGLSEADAERYATLANAFNDDMRRQPVGLAGELDLPDALVERMSMPQLFALVDAVVPDDLRTPTLRAVANERAGLATPPTEQSAGERALRLQFDVGNAFEERLARELGPEVAHELRRTDGGWASKTSLGGDCEGEGEIP
jgi:hypothetical protein